MYSVIVGNSAEKMLDKIPSDYYQLVVKHLLDLEQNPRPHGCKKLTGTENTYRVRVGVYRIIYTIKDEILTVEVIKIGHRCNVYK